MTNAQRRIGWLDGLRGIAAVQVVLLHYASAFLPAMAMMDPGAVHYAWENIVIASPLYFLIDGYSSVYIFFLLSGCALRYSFAQHPRAVLASMARRIVRLGLPMAAVTLLSAALFASMPAEHILAGEITGSQNWLGATAPLGISASRILHQIAFEGMLTGYSDASLFPASVSTALGLETKAHAFDTPLWTMHVEFVGSVLIILLVAVRAIVSDAVHAVLCVVICLALAHTALLLFVVGYLAAPVLHHAHRGRWIWLLGAVLIGVGIAFRSERVWLKLWGMLPLVTPTPPAEIDPFQPSMMAAILIFAGVALSPRLQRLLMRPGLRRLGNLSFSLYLVHYPILLTVGSAVVVIASRFVGFGPAIGIAFAVGVAVTIPAAAGFERWVDAPAIRLSRRVSRSRPAPSQAS